MCICVYCIHVTHDHIGLTIHHVKSSNVVVQSHRTVHTIQTKLQEIMKGTFYLFWGMCLEVLAGGNMG